MKYGPTPEFLGRLSPKDFPKDSTVSIRLKDDSACRFRNAFYHKEGDWIAIYTEAAGAYMFELPFVDSIQGPSRVIEDKYYAL